MTPADLQTLKTYINAQGDLSSEPNNGDGHFNIAVKLKQTASPDFYVWKQSVTIDDIMNSSGFDWTRVDNMTVGESRIWEYMTGLGSVNPNKSNIRAGVNEAFKGTAQDDAVRLAIFGICQRLATRGQRLYIASGGTTSNNLGVGPGIVVIEEVTPSDVQQARALP